MALGTNAVTRLQRSSSCPRLPTRDRRSLRCTAVSSVPQNGHSNGAFSPGDNRSSDQNRSKGIAMRPLQPPPSVMGSSVTGRQVAVSNGVKLTNGQSNSRARQTLTPAGEANTVNGRVQPNRSNGQASPNMRKLDANNIVPVQGSSRPNGVVVARKKVSVLGTMQGAAGEVVQSGMLSAPAYYFQEDSGSLPLDTNFEWAQENYSKTKRTIDVWTFIVFLRAQLFLLDKKWSYAGGYTEDKQKLRTRWLASYVRESILWLGPTFIKLGQLFSTRADLFPLEFTDELSKLQDRVPAFSSEKAVGIIERQLGAPVSVLFKSFERRPIAAASLGQVHRAVLRSGEEVVVKVQRPGLKALFDIDLANLKSVAAQLDNMDDMGKRDFSGIYEECASILYKEIDYINEGRNADRFRRNFRGTSWVRVPTVYWQYSSPSVLTLEYLPGIKVTNVDALGQSSLDAKLVAQRCTESYLIQILKHGFFHADPHPGNIAVDSQGRLVFYDFGMMGEIVPYTRDRLLDVFYAFYRRDADAVMKALIDLKIIVPTSDVLSVRRALMFFMDNFTREVERGEAVSAIGEDMFAIAVDQPFRFPATFTFVLRAFSTLEGIGKALDRDYKFVAVAQPYAQELLDLQSQQEFFLGELSRQAGEVTSAAVAMPMRVQKMESTISSMESGDLKLRVRVLEAERAARRAGVMQMATVHTIAALGFLNLGTQMAMNGNSFMGGGLMMVSSVFAALVGLGFRRVSRLDKFEQDIKGMGR